MAARGAAPRRRTPTGPARRALLGNNPDTVSTLFGVWAAGGVYVPINPRLTAAELDHVLGEAPPALVVADASDHDRVGGIPTVEPVSSARAAGAGG
ncbi:MAG: AMP-binding protein [Acidimicrobiia bacterium]|nr:AMP-binding protein [Acidimicrobiia bacterium]